jgi:hypothetical protein
MADNETVYVQVPVVTFVQCLTEMSINPRLIKGHTKKHEYIATKLSFLVKNRELGPKCIVLSMQLAKSISSSE